MKRRAPSPAASDNEADILDSLVDGGLDAPNGAANGFSLDDGPSGLDFGECVLFGHQPRGLRGHPVEGPLRRPQSGSGNRNLRRSTDHDHCFDAFVLEALIEI